MRAYIARLKLRIALNPRTFKIYSVLRFLVILTAIRCVFTRNYESLALCVLSLFLFLMPSFFEEKLQVQIPTAFQIIIYCFVYAAEILGEINHFYTAIPGWDTMLHTMNGFLCAAIGVSLAGILNRGSKHLSLSPFYVALMGFCFSMTIGVLWEFFEFSMDWFFHLDMQKDFIISRISSVSLDPNQTQTPVYVTNIVRSTIETADGRVISVDGFLDIGIIDTMKDLLVNFAGAVLFSVIGFFYEKNKKGHGFAESLLITPLSENELEEQNQQIDEQLLKEKEKRNMRFKRKNK